MRSQPGDLLKRGQERLGRGMACRKEARLIDRPHAMPVGWLLPLAVATGMLAALGAGLRRMEPSRQPETWAWGCAMAGLRRRPGSPAAPVEAERFDEGAEGLGRRSFGVARGAVDRDGPPRSRRPSGGAADARRMPSPPARATRRSS